MSIFKRSSGDVQQTIAAPSAEAGPEAGQPKFVPPAQGAAPGVVPPPAAPIYSTRPRTSTPNGAAAGVAMQRASSASRVSGERGRPRPVAHVMARTRPHTPPDPSACAQAGLLNLAWRWQEAGAPIRAIHTYVELLTRYPGTPAAATAVAELVDLSEKLAGEGQFHTALAIYDHLEHLA
jgi:hypothetical protein